MSDDLVLLYATGQLSQVPASVIRSFFGLLEAVESADDLADLAALRSLGMTETEGSVRFGLADGYACLATRSVDDGLMVLEFSALARRP